MLAQEEIPLECSLNLYTDIQKDLLFYDVLVERFCIKVWSNENWRANQLQEMVTSVFIWTKEVIP